MSLEEESLCEFVNYDHGPACSTVFSTCILARKKCGPIVPLLITNVLHVCQFLQGICRHSWSTREVPGKTEGDLPHAGHHSGQKG